MSIFEEMREFEKNFSDLALELSEALEKAEQLSDCVGDKYMLSDKNNGDYIRVNRAELLVDIRIIHDYVYKSYKLANKLGDMI